MLKKIEVSNYKSINKISIDVGRINIFIGENGAGKSNILEAIALAGAASANKLSNEFLISRGIRITPPDLMRSAFSIKENKLPIKIIAHDDINKVPTTYKLTNNGTTYSQWECEIESIDQNISNYMSAVDSLEKIMLIRRKNSILQLDQEKINQLIDMIKVRDKIRDDIKNSRPSIVHDLKEFVIFSPENSSLRDFEKDGQIEPLGINGEGLLKLFSVTKETNKELIDSIIKALHVFKWFNGIDIIDNSTKIKRDFAISDIFIKGGKTFDHRSSSEGLLFLLFYFMLYSSDLTPKIFAIDNIDFSLNPKLCENMMQEIAVLAEKHGKQSFITTHNPAILDGINLNDENQKIFVVGRNEKGETQVRPIKKQSTNSDYKPRLSEAFLRGALGGLPDNFA